MLNSTSISKITMNTPAMGIIQRSSEESFFVRFHHSSVLSGEIFTSEPKYKNNNVLVLQVLLIQDGYVLVELMKQLNQ